MTFRTPACRLAGAALALMLAPMLMQSPVRAQTLADALVKTYDTNPTLQISRSQLRQADEAVPQARSALFPDLTASTSLSTQDTTRDRTSQSTTSADATVSGEVSLWSGGRTQAQIRAAIASVMAARANLTATEQNVLQDAVTAFLDVRRDTQLVDVARNNVRVLTEQFRATQDRFDVGEVTQTDVSQAEAALAAARANLAASTGNLTQSRTAYQLTVGEAPGELAPPPRIPQLPETLEGAESLAIDQHPLLIAARFNEIAADEEVEIALAGLRPIVVLSGSAFAQQDLETYNNGDEERFVGASLAITAQVPLYRGGELDSLIREARERVAQRKAETQETGRQIRQSVQLAWSGLRVARASITANREQVAASEIAFNGVVEEAKFGERTTLDVLDTEQDLLTARSNLVSAQRDEVVAAYNLLAAVGLLTASHLGLSVTPYDPNANYDYVSQSPSTDDGGPRIERILDRWGQ